MAKGRIKTNYIDRLFSRYIRARAGYKCERCGAQHDRSSTGLHCSHIFSRRHAMTRWDPQNAVAHCYPCHTYLGGNPVIFTEWAGNYLGGTELDALRDRAMSVVKITDRDKKAIAADLRDKLKEMGEAP